MSVGVDTCVGDKQQLIVRCRGDLIHVQGNAFLQAHIVVPADYPKRCVQLSYSPHSVYYEDAVTIPIADCVGLFHRA